GSPRFSFTAPPPTETHTPSLHDALPISKIHIAKANPQWKGTVVANLSALDALGERTVRLVLPELGIDDAFFVAGFSIRPDLTGRSEEHTSELQSRENLVCRLLLEKKKEK